MRPGTGYPEDPARVGAATSQLHLCSASGPALRLARDAGSSKSCIGAKAELRLDLSCDGGGRGVTGRMFSEHWKIELSIRAVWRRADRP